MLVISESLGIPGDICTNVKVSIGRKRYIFSDVNVFCDSKRKNVFFFSLFLRMFYLTYIIYS